MNGSALRIVSAPENEAPGIPASEPRAELRLDWRRLGARLLVFSLGVEALLVVLDYHVNYGRLIDVGAMRRLFNIAREDGLASWFASTQTLMAGLTLAGVYLVDRSRGYLVLALGFLYMAVDDGAQLHERFAATFDALTERSTFAASFPSYTWQVLFLPLFGALGLYLMSFLWKRLPPGRARVVLLVAMMSMATAVVLDFFEGLDRDHPGNVYTLAVDRYPALDHWSQRRFGTSADECVRHFSKSMEETLEMAGMSLLWFLFVGRLGAVASDLRIRGT